MILFNQNNCLAVKWLSQSSWNFFPPLDWIHVASIKMLHFWFLVLEINFKVHCNHLKLILLSFHLFEQLLEGAFLSSQKKGEIFFEWVLWVFLIAITCVHWLHCVLSSQCSVTNFKLLSVESGNLWWIIYLTEKPRYP